MNEHDVGAVVAMVAMVTIVAMATLVPIRVYKLSFWKMRRKEHLFRILGFYLDVGTVTYNL